MIEPCPFCGSRDQISIDSQGFRSVSVGCWECGITARTTWEAHEHHDQAQSRALAAWNRRAPVAAEVERAVAERARPLVEACREALDWVPDHHTPGRNARAQIKAALAAFEARSEKEQPR